MPDSPEINNITQKERLADMSVEEMKAELAALYRNAYSGPALVQSNIEWMQTLERAIESRRLAATTTPGYRLQAVQDKLAQLQKTKKKSPAVMAQIGALTVERNRLERANVEQLGQSAAAKAFKYTSTYGKNYKALDAGAASTAKVQQIREMMGLSEWGNAGFLLPQTNPETGELIGWQNNPAFSSVDASGKAQEFRFGPANQRIGQRAGSFVGGRNLDMLTGMSVNEMKDFYMSLSPDELRKVQLELKQSGLLEGESVQWGMRDDQTEQAFVSMMIAWADRPDVNLRQLLDEMKRNHSAQLDSDTRKVLGTDLEAALGDQYENITIADAESLAQMVDTISGDLLGTELDPGVKARLIAKLQEQEKAYKMNDASTRFQQTVAQQKAAAGGATSELEAFMGALIGQESGGDPNAVNTRTGAAGLGQMMDWSGWAREAGVDPGDFSAENQKRVIRYKLAQYYALFGNWRDVAIAWYGGGGAPDLVNSGQWSATAPQGNGDEPSFNDYADSVIGRMNANLQSKLASGSADPALNFNVTEQLPDASTRIEAELKALDPKRYYGTKFFRGADVFFNMLRSPI